MEKKSPLWYLLPIFFGIIGGGIVYFILKNSDEKKAERAIIIGMIFSIPMCIWFSTQVGLGSVSPLYVMGDNGMYPTIQTYDVVAVDSYAQFNDVNIGDIIAFYSPDSFEKGIERVIVSRVTGFIDDDGRSKSYRFLGDTKILKTEGDNDSAIRGKNYPITENEYIGKVKNIIPQVGYLLSFPTLLILIISYFGLPTIWVYFSHRDLSRDTLEKISDMKVASESKHSAICPLCKSENILHDLRNSQYRCSDCNWSGYISRKYSDVWYLLPILVGIIGGLIFYLVIKDDDKDKAIKGLILGVIISAISILLYALLIIATGFLLF